MILATEAIAAAATAAIAASMAFRHWVRAVSRADSETRVIVAVALFVALNAFIAADEFYWGITRHLGMPTFLVYGWPPLTLKILSMYVLSGGVIWLYARRWRVVQAVGIPSACWLAACTLENVLP